MPPPSRPRPGRDDPAVTDTALFSGTCGLPGGMKFFGAEHVVVATDAPFGPIGPTLAALDGFDLSAEDRHLITCGNAARMLRMS